MDPVKQEQHLRTLMNSREQKSSLSLLNQEMTKRIETIELTIEVMEEDRSG